MRDYFLPIGFFSSLSPCWFFIRGGKWCKPPRKVSYKCTFGASDQGQLLDVWGQHPDDVNPTVKIHRFTTSSGRFTDSIFHPAARNRIMEKYRRIGISANILNHTDRKERYFPSNSHHVQSDLVCDEILSSAGRWCFLVLAEPTPKMCARRYGIV